VTRPAAVAVLLSAALLTHAADPYSPKDGRFSVKFPGEPKESTQKTKTPLGELKVFSATWANADGNAFLVSYTDFPAGTAGAADRGTLYDGARDALKAKDGKGLSEKDVEVGSGKLAGRDVEIEKGKQRMRFRFVVRDDRLYQVAVVGTASFVEGKDAAAFLASFELTK